MFVCISFSHVLAVCTVLALRWPAQDPSCLSCLLYLDLGGFREHKLRVDGDLSLPESQPFIEAFDSATLRTLNPKPETLNPKT